MTTLSDLDSLLQQAMDQKAAKAIKLATKPAVTSQTVQKSASANELAAKIEAELAWETQGIVCLSRIQNCSCGASFHSQDGLFYNQTNRITKSRRLLRIKFYANHTASHAHTHETITEEINLCTHCISDRTIGDDLLRAVDGRRSGSVPSDYPLQLSLFNDHPAKKFHTA